MKRVSGNRPSRSRPSQAKAPGRRPGGGPSTRALAFRAALACVRQAGLRGCTSGAVAKRAGISQALVMYHFPTMDALYRELTQWTLEQLVADSTKEIQLAKDPLDALVKYVQAPFDWGSRNPVLLSLLLYSYAESPINAEFRSLNSISSEAGRARIEGLLDEISTKSEGYAHLKPAQGRSALGLEIQCLITGFVFQAFTDDGVTFEELRDHAVRVVLERLRRNP